MERHEMTIQQFADNVLDHLFDTHPGMEETHNAEIKEVLKNNGQMREALVLKANDENIAPTIYLEKFFDDFKDGALLGDICDKIIDMYEQSRNPQNISVDFFTDFDQAKERLAMNRLTAAIIFTSQGIPFFLHGEEILRSKDFNENSFNMPLTLNAVRYDLTSEQADMLSYYRELIKLRKSLPELHYRTVSKVLEEIE